MSNNYKLYSFILEPLSAFSTPIKGDTLFGMFVWQLAHNNKLLSTSFDNFIKDYKNNIPYIIFSSAYLYKNNFYYFNRPKFPVKKDCVTDFEAIKNRKLEKKKNYFKVSQNEIVENFNIEINKNNFGKIDIIEEGVIHNKISRQTFTTGEGTFAPYMTTKKYFPKMRNISIFVLVDETKISLDSLKIALDNIGKQGYGKDASIGMGKFKIIDVLACKLADNRSKKYYSLSPFVYDENDEFEDIYYEPFTRYGKHGDHAVFTGNPFKNPILMIDDGAIIIYDKAPDKIFVGKAIKNISRQFDGNVIHQGFSIIIPCKGDFVE